MAHDSHAAPIPASADTAQAAYWRANLRLVALLLALWFTGSFGAGILWVDTLDQLRLPGSGFRLGFWFAQQGSIYLFLVLIVVYAVAMDRIDRAFGVREEEGILPPGVRPDLEEPADETPGTGPAGGGAR